MNPTENRPINPTPYNSREEAEAELAKASHGDTRSYWEAVRRWEATPAAH